MKSILEFLESKRGGILIKCILLLTAFLIGLLLPSPFSRMEYGHVTSSDEELSDTINMVLENGVYTGSIVNGTKIRHGDGRFEMTDGSIYMGEWKKDALPYGKKQTRYSIYTGEFDEELRNHGFGIIEYNEDYFRKKREDGFSDVNIVAKYIGNWVRDNKSGLGRAIMKDESMQFGIYSNGLLQSVEGAHYRIGGCVYGIDASHHQQDIDWNQLAIYCDENGRACEDTPANQAYMQPVFFVYLKATEGATERDDKYRDRKDDAKKHGIVQGSYHILRLLTSSIDDQLENFFATAIWVSGDLPPALDIEFEKEIEIVISNYGKETFYTMILKWLKEVEKKYGVKPIIYTNESIRNNYLQDDRLKGYDVWIAKYGNKPQNFDWHFWQMTEKGQIRGNKGYIDINLYKGDYTSFMEYVNR